MNTCKIIGCNELTRRNNMCARHSMQAYLRAKGSEYRTWQSMKARCSNPNNKDYARYGGRGISVCDRWANNFLAFLRDMGKKPSPLHSIDRINNDGNYEPENCQWATKQEQSINQGSMKNNSTGFKNVFFEKNKYYVVRVKRNGVRKYVGYFTDIMDAVKARDDYLESLP